MDTKEKLYAPFTNIRSRRGKGGTYDYVSWKDVADRMNEVFGNTWSSEVRSQETFGKDVVVKVRVTVFNDVAGPIYQEGFGGATNFEGSEPGNAYKSAYSKALKDACKKWGVGLYLEEDDTSGSSMPPGYSGKEYGVPPQGAPMSGPKTAPPTDVPPSTPYPGETVVNNVPVPPAPSVNVTPPPVEEKPTFPVDEPAVAQQYNAPAMPPQGTPVPSPTTGGMPLPPGVAMEVQAETTIRQEEPAAQSMPTPPPAGPPVPPTPPTVNLSAGEKPMSKAPMINTGDTDKISDVQKAALSSILNIKGVEYETLVKEAFEANGVVKNPIPVPDDLTYQEAVYVVKYGNDKFRRR